MKTEIPIAQCKLDEYRAKEEAATEGPWWMTLYEDERNREIWAGPECCATVMVCETTAFPETENDEDNGQFIAMAREAVPALLAEVARLKQFEPPVCGECGEYKSNDFDLVTSEEVWMCEECD